MCLYRGHVSSQEGKGRKEGAKQPVEKTSTIKGQLGVPLTYVYPWYFLCSLGILAGEKSDIGPI